MVTSHGKTSLGEAARLGNMDILKLLLDCSTLSTRDRASHNSNQKNKRHFKSQKRKLNFVSDHDETVIKCKNVIEKTANNTNTKYVRNEFSDKNRGYFVFVHDEESTADDNNLNILKSPVNSVSLTPSPQADLEWDEDIGNFAPVTSDDEAWSSLYK